MRCGDCQMHTGIPPLFHRRNDRLAALPVQGLSKFCWHFKFAGVKPASTSEKRSHSELSIKAQLIDAFPKCQQLLVQLGVHTTVVNKACYHWGIGEIVVALFTPGCTSNAAAV